MEETEQSKTKNTKNKIILNEEDDEYNSYSDSDFDSDIEDIIEEEYYQDVLKLLQKELLNYVEMKSLPICEYLTIENIHSFISDVM